MSFSTHSPYTNSLLPQSEQLSASKATLHPSKLVIGIQALLSELIMKSFLQAVHLKVLLVF